MDIVVETNKFKNNVVRCGFIFKQALKATYNLRGETEMNSFVTKLSKHCYYGNITNILNCYGESINESELVLLSGALICDLRFNKSLFLGISNEACQQGLDKIGYQLKQLDNDYCNYYSLLNNQIPVLLLINTRVLTYNNIFLGTNRNHCIVLVKDSNKTIEISDSFVRTIPMSVFQGNIDAIAIRDEIQTNRASGIYIEKQDNQKYNYSIKNALIDYLEINSSFSVNSILYILQTYCRLAIKNVDILFNKESLNDLAYDIKVAGIATRFDYIANLFANHINYSVDIETLTMLKTKWELVASKLIKCSMTLNKDYYKKIFEMEIPILIDKEMRFYKETYEKMKSFKITGVEKND